jgi:hypothetical protein
MSLMAGVSRSIYAGILTPGCSASTNCTRDSGTLLGANFIYIVALIFLLLGLKLLPRYYWASMVLFIAPSYG